MISLSHWGMFEMPLRYEGKWIVDKPNYYWRGNWYGYNGKEWVDVDR